MTSSISAHKNPRGRPKTGQDPTISVRLNPVVVQDINTMAKARQMRRSDLVRELIIYALNRLEPSKPPGMGRGSEQG